MVGNFHYLASYTAAIAAGFTNEDGLAIARAARYVDDCAEFTVPPSTPPDDAESVADALRIWPVFHYLPGDAAALAPQVNPLVLQSGTPEVLFGLPLICQTGGHLIQLLIRRAKDIWTENGTRERQLQAIGIAMHTLLDTFLHQGFVGFPAPMLNGAQTILTVGTLPRSEFRKCLCEALNGNPETAFSFTPYLPAEAPDGFLGCEQLAGLSDCPNAVFQYHAPWAIAPTVMCINPLRFANAYQCLRSALRYIRGVDSSFSGQAVEDPSSLLELCYYFASVQCDSSLPETWFQQFVWLPKVSDYCTPTQEADASYIFNFKLQAIAQRNLVWNACPYLRDCAEHFPGAAPEVT